MVLMTVFWGTQDAPGHPFPSGTSFPFLPLLALSLSVGLSVCLPRAGLSAPSFSDDPCPLKPCRSAWALKGGLQFLSKQQPREEMEHLRPQG